MPDLRRFGTKDATDATTIPRDRHLGGSEGCEPKSFAYRRLQINVSR